MSFIDIFNQVQRKEETPPPVPCSPEQLSLLTAQEEYYQKREATQLMKWNRWLRLGFSGVIVLIVSLWLLVVAGIVLLDGFHYKGFSLTPSVLVTLIGGSSVNIIGLLAIVVRDIFPGNPSKIKPNRTGSNSIAQ